MFIVLTSLYAGRCSRNAAEKAASAVLGYSFVSLLRMTEYRRLPNFASFYQVHLSDLENFRVELGMLILLHLGRSAFL